MVMRVSIVLAIAFAVALPLATAVPASAQSYPMTCQIGTMNLALVDIGSNLATVAFARSNGPVVSGLRPGQCAFADRAVRATEPTKLCFEATIARISLRGATASAITFSGPGAAALQSAVYGPTKLMNFTVRNWNIPAVGGACFQIDSYGP